MKYHRLQIKNVPYFIICIYALVLILVSFMLSPVEEIFRGFWNILLSPSNLITDYMEIGGIGAAFFNSGLVTLISGIILKRLYTHVTGPLIAAVFTVSGFSFFGKNIFNSISIMAGVYLFSVFSEKSAKDVTLTAIFATSLAPLVSEIAFNLPTNSFFSIIISQIIGILAGLIIYPVSEKFYHFHKGFSLYNVGFSAGVIGMIFTGLMKMFELNIQLSNIIYKGSETPIKYFFLILLFFLLLIGLFLSHGKIDGVLRMQKQTGRSITDFIENEGLGYTLINMALVGFTGYLFLILVNARFNGPVLGALLTMVGFAAFGKTPKNIIPVMMGITIGVLLGKDHFENTSVVIMCLFGTALAPISGSFGIIAGLIAGFMHAGLVGVIGDTHGGLNLYNNGFSSGFIAAVIVSIREGFKGISIDDDIDYNKELNNPDGR